MHCIMYRCKQQAKSLLKEGKKSQVWAPFCVLCLFIVIGEKSVLTDSHFFLSQALRCLRGSKRVEKKADRLFAQLETVKGILDRIANSQTDRLVRCTNTQMHWPSAVSVNVTHTSPRQHSVVLLSTLLKTGIPNIFLSAHLKFFLEVLPENISVT